MPMPLWFGRLNKRVFNPREIRLGKRPVLIHVGRKSGTTYETPLEPHPIEGGVIVTLMYSSKSDWVQNVLAAGGASLRSGGTVAEVSNPRIITLEQAQELWDPNTNVQPGFMRVSEYLRLDVTVTNS